MTPDEIKQLIEAKLEGAVVSVTSPDNVHFDAVVKAPQFKDVSRVKAQQLVYGALGTHITDGTIHALSLKTETLD